MNLGIDNTVFNHTLMKLTFRRLKMDTFDLHPGNKTNFKSSDQIVYSVFSITPYQEMFPVLFVTFHKFQGWNIGGCNYGGYAIELNVDDPILISTIIGPFCSATSPRYEYTSQHSLSHYVLNNKTTHLIVYGYGRMYTIDVDIKIEMSPCAGILEPLLMWYPRGNDRLIPDDVLTTTFATVSLEVLSNMTLSLHVITFQNISKCFFLQSMSYPSVTRIYYDILIKNGDFKMHYYKAPSFIESYVHGSYGNVWVKFIRHYERAIWRKFVVTSILSVLDLLQVSIEQYTGEAIEYLSFFSLFKTTKQTGSCSSSNDELAEPLSQKHKGYIYANTYKSCILDIFVPNATYVYILSSKLSLHQYTSKSIWYIHFLKVDCNQVPGRGWDTITTRLTFARLQSTSHTVDFIKDEVYLESHHSVLSFVYRRRQKCRSVVMRYRDVSVNLLASYIRMDKQGRARIRVNMITCTAFIYNIIQCKLTIFATLWNLRN